MNLEELLDDVDKKAIESIKDKIDSCHQHEYASGVMYWRFQLRMLLDEIKERKDAN